jgi:hypothetical protein
MGNPTLRPCPFEASEDTITKSKLQALHVIRIKYSKAGGRGNPPSLIPVLWNIGILPHKQATQTKHFDDQCPLLVFVNFCPVLSEFLKWSFVYKNV